MINTHSSGKRFYTALLHAPVVNRHGEEGVTAVTNLDLHDIARSSRTYGASGYFVVSPLEVQHRLVERILSHWQTSQARAHHPDRVEALKLLRLARDFSGVVEAVQGETGRRPSVWMPDAREWNPDQYPRAQQAGGESDPHRLRVWQYADARALWREEIQAGDLTPWIVVFGTGWGLSESFFPAVDRILAPVYGPEGKSGYNHLSVRAAAGIVLDRLFGT